MTRRTRDSLEELITALSVISEAKYIEIDKDEVEAAELVGEAAHDRLYSEVARADTLLFDARSRKKWYHDLMLRRHGTAARIDFISDCANLAQRTQKWRWIVTALDPEDAADDDLPEVINVGGRTESFSWTMVRREHEAFQLAVIALRADLSKHDSSSWGARRYPVVACVIVERVRFGP